MKVFLFCVLQIFNARPSLAPQTLSAYAVNGRVAHGAPLRLSCERQLGFKQATDLMRVRLWPISKRSAAEMAVSGKIAATNATPGSEILQPVFTDRLAKTGKFTPHLPDVTTGE